MHDVERIALDRLGLLTAPATPAGGATPEAVAVALAELARVGVAVTNPEALTGAAVARVPDIVRHVHERRGQSSSYAPLFDGFPDALPAVDHVAVRAVLGWARLAGVTDPTAEQVRAAFDFSSLGWWPASSVPQDVPAAVLARAHQDVLPADGHVEWSTVRVVDPAEAEDALRTWMREAFAAAASLREDVRADLAALTRLLGVAHVDPATVRFRETRTLLTRLVWETDRAVLPTLGLTPDDLLRLFADLTGTDVALRRGVRHPRLSRADRRVVVACLERSDRLGDVFRRRGLWLAIARGLHVDEHDAPRTRQVVARLRASRHDPTSLASRVERLLVEDYPAAVALLARESPGALVRSLRRLAALAAGTPGHEDALARALADSAASAPVRVLLTARAGVDDDGRTYPRVAVTPSGSALLVSRAPGHLALPDGLRTRLLEALTTAVRTQLAGRGSWAGERVHVADGLDRVLMPDGLRSTAAGLVQVERGSALPLGDAAVLRLFVHWRHPASDLDLSCLALDEDFVVVDHVSWTRLRSGVMVHSGDVTSAPAGAEEFLDVDLGALAEAGAPPAGQPGNDPAARRPWWRRAVARSASTPGPQVERWRYLAPAVFRYSGPRFDDLEEAWAGWMLRDRADRSRAVFDPAAVAGAFPLTGGLRTVVPFLVDVRAREVVHLDLRLPGSPHARVEREGGLVGELTRALVARRATRTDVATLVTENVAARGGTVVTDRSSATLTVGVDAGCTYDVLRRPERLLAHLL
ncbi:hypothetical protein J1G44_17545 [Cellulomonas sp. zg-ZUI199]|uniref:Lantibiotic dehydratase N-terminal domain-containing protein n=1 Tax=Cellulomonas wangleii TaxID=2816956 RepID=A0ABX8D8H8_9CELL|nr:hypothetical protein [Cellulomonas wangleii]MBO0926282.1 hypothetical protein [Cellulomonas wangleii]QVI62786.1 hypothetical protein KG103_02260 [Cellulomonas wangleii]